MNKPPTLDEILDVDEIYKYLGEGNDIEYIEYVKSQIIKLVEEIIGEDSGPFNVFENGGMKPDPTTYSRNQLRAEQRAKLRELSNE